MLQAFSPCVPIRFSGDSGFMICIETLYTISYPSSHLFRFFSFQHEIAWSRKVCGRHPTERRPAGCVEEAIRVS